MIHLATQPLSLYSLDEPSFSDYDGPEKARAKGENKDDGTVEWCHYEKGSVSRVHYMDVQEKWMDQEGAVYFKAFVDKDMGKHGKKLVDIIILPTDILHQFMGTIVICAAIYSTEIVNEIKNMGLKNKILVLK